MDKKIGLVLFCLVVPLFMVLLGYKIFLVEADFTVEQQAWLDSFQSGGFPEGYTELEVSHMNDVKDVMEGMRYAFLGLLLLVTLILNYYKRNRKFSGKLLHYSGLSTVAVIGIFGGVVSIGFDWMFRIFHNIFFPQGNWQFDVGSMLLADWPIQFFIDATKDIFLYSLIGGILFIVVGRYLKNDR